jgi:GT2 family glycosyltransferase
VVICTRDRGALATAAVASVLASTGDQIEVLLVDQSTDDRTALAVQKLGADPRVRYVRVPARGLGSARNEGLRRARGPIVAFTDDDCVVAGDWIHTIRSIFDTDRRVAIVFANVEAAPHDSTRGFIPAYVRSGTVVLTKVRHKCRARGIGASMAVRRAAADDVGGFDSLLGAGARFPSCEDGDMALRCLLRGWRVVETDRTSVVHSGFRTWEQGRSLARSSMIGIGAAYAKPLKAGRVAALPVLAYEVWVAMSKPFRSLWRIGRPEGLRDLPNLVRGIVSGLRTSIDPETLRYRDVHSERVVPLVREVPAREHEPPGLDANQERIAG